MEGERQESDSAPDAHAVVHHVSLNEELACTSIEEMEKPLLGGVGSVMPDVTTSVSGLLIEILFSIPCSVLHLWHSETLSVDESDVLHVTELVVGKSSSCSRKNNTIVSVINCFQFHRYFHDPNILWCCPPSYLLTFRVHYLL